MNRTLDIAKAQAFSLWVKSVIGEKPMVSIERDHVAVEFTQEQKNKLIAWLDRQLIGSMTAEENQDVTLRLNFGGVLFPWAMRYVLPAAAVVFIMGYATKGFRDWR